VNKNNNIIATIFLIVGTVAVMCISFVYIHWTAYKIAAFHIDYAEYVPPAIMCIASLAVLVISVKKHNKRFVYKYVAIFSLIMIVCAITMLLNVHAYCPVCNYVDDDKWYPIIYQLIENRSYEPI